MTHMTRLWPSAAAALTLVVSSCRSKDAEPDRGAAPPPVASARPDVCAQGGGKVEDSVTEGFFERQVGGYCVDPNGETRTYGENAKGTLDDVCIQQFDGECEVYKHYGLRRVVTVRYVDGAGSPGAVAVTLSRFDSKEGALGFYTKRVVADGDPLRVAPAKLEAGGAGALGSGIAYVWKGEYVAELSYTNETEPPDAVRASSKAVLPPLAVSIGRSLTGSTELPKDAASLPGEDMIPQGLRYEVDDVLGIAGVGPGAIGYYRAGEKRFRQFVLVRPEEDSAKDVLGTLKKHPSAKDVKDQPFHVIALVIPHDEDRVMPEWLVGRTGTRVFGVGDEDLVMTADQSATDREKVLLSRDEKLARLRALPSSTPAP
jgi:hypothetical protein